MLRCIFRILAPVALLFLFPITDATAQSRVALVIANSNYEHIRALPTPAADAGLVTETLRAAGYDVTQLQDLRADNFGQPLRDFLDKITQRGASTDVVFYFSGFGVQHDGDNFLLPIDANITTDSDVTAEAFRLSDLIGELAALPAHSRVVILDASRQHNLGQAAGHPLAQGLSIMQAPQGLVIASAAAPDGIAIDGDGITGLYTTLLVTQMRQPGLELKQILEATRLQVSNATNSRQIPWNTGSLDIELRWFDAEATPSTPTGVTVNPPTPVAVAPTIRAKEDLQALSSDDAYTAVIALDTLQGYQWFVELFPTEPKAAEIWAIIENRRQQLLWRRAVVTNTKRAYWNYERRYPGGDHIYEAQGLLEDLNDPVEPPDDYVATPEPLPPDYDDEAVGVVEDIVQAIGAVTEPVAPVFDPAPPVFIPVPPAVINKIHQNLTDKTPIKISTNPVKPPLFDPKKLKVHTGPDVKTPVISQIKPINKPVVIKPPVVKKTDKPQKKGMEIPPNKKGPGPGPKSGPVTTPTIVHPPVIPPAIPPVHPPVTPPAVPPAHPPVTPPVVPLVHPPVTPAVVHPPVVRQPPRPAPVVRQPPRPAPVVRQPPRPVPVVRQPPRPAPVVRQPVCSVVGGKRVCH